MLCRRARATDATRRCARAGFVLLFGVACGACAVGKQQDRQGTGEPNLVPQVDCSHCGPGQSCLAGSGECYCDASRCNGCCTADGRCVSGDQTDACGKAGLGCFDCAQVGPLSSCQAGSCSGCTPRCDGRQCGGDGCGGSCGSCPKGTQCGANGRCQCTPHCAGKCAGAPDGCGGTCASNACAGCCEGVLCRSGLSLTACGGGGGQCRSCGSNDPCQQASCTSGSCVATARPDGTVCGASGTCVAGQCVAGGGSVYNSCYGYCGSHDAVPGSSPACFCDPLCVTEGDCCPDVGWECGIH